MSRTFSINNGSGDSLKVSLRCGRNPNACQIRLMVMRLSPVAVASDRVLQCVAPGGGVSSVTITTRSTCAAVTVRGAPGGRWQTSTFLAALRVTGLTAPGVFDGAIDGESFRAYIDQILVPTLHPGDIVIADNLGAHKVAGVQRALQAAGATLWYLPPYSPDLNPIELCFAKLKALVRTARCRRTETLWPFLGECLAHFSPDACRNYFRHCGYSAATRS